jgi:hypothetical protein
VSVSMAMAMPVSVSVLFSQELNEFQHIGSKLTQ